MRFFSLYKFAVEKIHKTVTSAYCLGIKTPLKNRGGKLITYLENNTNSLDFEMVAFDKAEHELSICLTEDENKLREFFLEVPGFQFLKSLFCLESNLA